MNFDFYATIPPSFVDQDRVIIEFNNISRVPAETVHYGVVLLNIRTTDKPNLFRISPHEKFSKQFFSRGQTEGMLPINMTHSTTFLVELKKNPITFK